MPVHQNANIFKMSTICLPTIAWSNNYAYISNIILFMSRVFSLLSSKHKWREKTLKFFFRKKIKKYLLLWRGNSALVFVNVIIWIIHCGQVFMVALGPGKSLQLSAVKFLLHILYADDSNKSTLIHMNFDKQTNKIAIFTS